MEIWKDVKGYEGLYQVSNHGQIRSLDRYIKYKGREDKLRLIKGVLKPGTLNNHGYLKVSLFKDGKGETREIQRIVAENWIDNPMNKEQVNHIDGDKTNNRVENLEWVTPSENKVHSLDILNHGLAPVDQYDLSGNFIRSFKSIKEAGEVTGIARCSISNVLAGKRNRAGQYKWKRKEKA